MATKPKDPALSAEVSEILDTLKKDQNVRHADKCRTGVVLEQLEEPARTAITIAVMDPDISLPAITRFIQNAGHTIHRSTLEAHRKGTCACARK